MKKTAVYIGGHFDPDFKGVTDAFIISEEGNAASLVLVADDGTTATRVDVRNEKNKVKSKKNEGYHPYFTVSSAKAGAGKKTGKKKASRKKKQADNTGEQAPGSATS